MLETGTMGWWEAMLGFGTGNMGARSDRATGKYNAKLEAKPTGKQTAREAKKAAASTKGGRK
jgi:hypothetical protein